MNSFITPLLTIYFLLKFSSLFCKKTSTLIIIAAGYLFTGIGLWNDSWFYWQDQMFMWLILYAVIGLLVHTCKKNYCFFCGALICFTASANYWTLHNILFIMIVIVLFICTRENTVSFLKEKLKNLYDLIRQNKILSILTFINCAIWVIIIASVFMEQHADYTRHITSKAYVNGGYTVQKAFERAIGIGLSYITVEIWNPVVNGDVSIIGYNFIHYARYIGIMLLPCIALGIYHKSKQVTYFLGLSIINFVICLVPGFLLPIWNIFLKFDQHFFYFYAHFFEISLLFLAALSFEECVLDKKNNKNILKVGIVAALIYILGGFLMGYGSERRFIISAALFALSVFLLWLYNTSAKQIWIVLFLILYLGDVTRYYYESSLGDYTYIDEVAHKVGEHNELLREPFTFVGNNTFEAGIAENSPPVFNFMWPTNKYLPSVSYVELLEFEEKEDFKNHVDYSFEDREDLHFYSKTDTFEDKTVFNKSSRVQGEYTITQYGYNDWKLECKSDENAFVLFNIMYDKNWEVLVDGEKVETDKANLNYVYIELSSGQHNIELHYRPFARTVYPGASVLLLVTLIILYAGCWDMRQKLQKFNK